MVAGLLLILDDVDLHRRRPHDVSQRDPPPLPEARRERIGEVLSAMSLLLRKWLVTQLIAMLVIGVRVHHRAAHPRREGAVRARRDRRAARVRPDRRPDPERRARVAMGFLDSPEKALYVGVVYLGIQQLEGHLLIPLL